MNLVLELAYHVRKQHLHETSVASPQVSSGPSFKQKPYQFSFSVHIGFAGAYPLSLEDNLREVAWFSTPEGYRSAFLSLTGGDVEASKLSNPHMILICILAHLPARRKIGWLSIPAPKGFVVTMPAPGRTGRLLFVFDSAGLGLRAINVNLCVGPDVHPAVGDGCHGEFHRASRSIPRHL
jgi:hypothetical protein